MKKRTRKKVQGRGPQRWKKVLTFSLRLLVTLGLLFLIYRKIDVQLIKNIILHLPCHFFILALMVFFISNITGAVQYYFLLKSHRIPNLNFLLLVKVYLFSTFFNNFLPTNIGGDSIKVYKLIQLHINKKIIFSSVIWDRFISILILVFLSLLSGFILTRNHLFLTGLLLFLFMVLVFVLLINKFRFGKVILGFVFRLRNPKVRFFLHEFLASFKIYLKRSTDVLIFYMISIITQLLKIFFTVFIAQAVHLSVSLLELSFILPVIGIVSALPVSINGLGIREYIGGILFAYLNKDKALVSFFITLGNIIIILANSLGILFIFGEKAKAKK